MHQQRRQRPVDSFRRPVRHHRRTTRLGFQQFARYADLIEQFSHAFGGNPLTRTRVRPEVGCADPDQLGIARQPRPLADTPRSPVHLCLCPWAPAQPGGTLRRDARKLL